MIDLTPELVARLLRYDGATGKLYWLPRPTELFKSAGDAKRWHSNFCGKEALTAINSEGYKIGVVHGRQCKAHRIAWVLAYGEWPAGEIDHLNGDRSDNRLVNLRDATRASNQRNAKMQSNNTSGVTGVYWWAERQRWRAEIKVDGKARHLGLFATKEEAAAARGAANEQFGFTDRHGKPAA